MGAHNTNMQVLKVYLVQVEQEEPFRLNLAEVYSIDHEHRALRKEEVLWLTEERDPRLITLRIRQVIVGWKSGVSFYLASCC